MLLLQLVINLFYRKFQIEFISLFKELYQLSYPCIYNGLLRFRFKIFIPLTSVLLTEKKRIEDKILWQARCGWKMNLCVCHSNTEQHKTDLHIRVCFIEKEKEEETFIIDTLVYVRYTWRLFFSIKDCNFKQTKPFSRLDCH